jgi:hypothetical protein
MNFIELDDAKFAVAAYDPADEAQLTKYCQRASAIIWDYLKKPSADPPIPEWTPETAEAVVVAATLLMLGHLWEHRGDDTESEPDPKIWDAIALLLVRKRDPALA